VTLRTIGRRHVGPLVGTGLCSICGARYSMAKLVKNGDGQWACSGPGTLNDARGRTSMDLAREIAQHTESVSQADLQVELAAYDRGDR
jgi:hypothetical protein